MIYVISASIVAQAVMTRLLERNLGYVKSDVKNQTLQPSSSSAEIVISS